MKNTRQKWIVRLIIATLFIFTALYVLYLLNGYHYDVFANQLRKTGMIQVTYDDPSAELYLDGELVDSKLPLIVGNLLPAEYKVSIRKDGYIDYSTDLNVQADLINVLNSVFLLPNDVAGSFVDVFKGDVRIPKAFMDDGRIFIVNASEIKYTTLKSQLIDSDLIAIEYENADMIKSIKVVGRSLHIMLENGDEDWVFLNEEQEPINDENLKDTDGVLFNNLWFTYEGSLVETFDRNTGDFLWFKQLPISLKITDLNFYQFKGGDYLVVKTMDSVKGYLFKLVGDELRVIDRGDFVQVGEDWKGDLVYVKGNREIWRYLQKQDQKLLLSRFSEDIVVFSFNIEQYKTRGMILFRMGDMVLLADENLEKIVDFWDENSLVVVDAEFASDKNLYLLFSEKSEKIGLKDKKVSSLQLKVLNLEEK